MNTLTVNALCAECTKPLPTSYVKCHHCKSNYHYNPCTTVSENTYARMNVDKKADWMCHRCRKSKSPLTNVFSEINLQKQQRDDDMDVLEETKRFKDSLSLDAVNSNLCSVQADVTDLKSNITGLKSDVTELKTDMKEIKASIIEISTSLSNNNAHMNNALAKITDALAALTTQVTELHQKNSEKEKQITEMDIRINKLEQQLINKNIEISNVEEKEMGAVDIVKCIAASVSVIVNDADISNAYRTRKGDKIIAEFTTTNKKNELMQKIKGHRIDANVINKTPNVDRRNNYIYVNEQLTFNNRRLLWLTKTKARECNWQFIWVRNGNIFARKAEKSPAIIIKNNADIENITATV